MYMVVPAAGQGTRLRPLTDSRPKCMVPLKGRPLLEWQLATARHVGLTDIAVVKGYLGDEIQCPDVTYFDNPRFEVTNMVETIMCARSVFDDGFVVSYGDIVYQDDVLAKLVASEHDIGVVVDQGWRDYWDDRFSDVLSDAESLQVDPDGLITDIGQKTTRIEDIQAQYIGLMAFRGDGVDAFLSLYERAKQCGERGERPLRGQRTFEMLYMTDMLQGLVDAGFPVTQVPVTRGWLEIDSVSDLEYAERTTQIDGRGLLAIG